MVRPARWVCLEEEAGEAGEAEPGAQWVAPKGEYPEVEAEEAEVGAEALCTCQAQAQAGMELPERQGLQAPTADQASREVEEEAEEEAERQQFRRAVLAASGAAAAAGEAAAVAAQHQCCPQQVGMAGELQALRVRPAPTADQATPEAGAAAAAEEEHRGHQP